jgi:hypothetical protein
MLKEELKVLEKVLEKNILERLDSGIEFSIIGVEFSIFSK